MALVTRNVTKLRNDSLVHGCKCNNNLAGTNQLLRSLPIYLRCFRIAEVYFGISRPCKLWKVYCYYIFFCFVVQCDFFSLMSSFFLLCYIMVILSRIRNLDYFGTDVSEMSWEMSCIVNFNNFCLNVSNKLKWVWFGL